MKYHNDLRAARRFARNSVIAEIIGLAIAIIPICLVVSWVMVQVTK